MPFVFRGLTSCRWRDPARRPRQVRRADACRSVGTGPAIGRAPGSFPQTVRIHAGNPVIWIAAAFALSFRWPWVGVLALLKPSLFPFAFGGVRTREWWLALGALAAVSLAFLPMWFDWIGVMLNARGQFSGPLYSLRDVPLMLIPLVRLAGQDRSSAFGIRLCAFIAGHPRRALPAGEAATPAAAPRDRRRTHAASPPRARSIERCGRGANPCGRDLHGSVATPPLGLDVPAQRVDGQVSGPSAIV